MKIDLIKRAEITQKTVDYYQGRDFVWGKCDCAQMVIRHASLAKRKIKWERYSDALGALKSIRAHGFDTLGAAMDAHFRRIDPREHLIGDIIEVPGTDSLTSLMIAVGNGRTIGFVDILPSATILEPKLVSGAWSLG